MDANMSAALDRADELWADLEREYRAAIVRKNVTPRAQQLTHEILERLRSALDRAANRYFNERMAAALGPEETAKATVYFPVAGDQQAFNSTMGRWRWKSVRAEHQRLEELLRAAQPFTAPENGWLAQLADLANEGKHVDLAPQRHIQHRKTTVTSSTGGSISWDSGVKFGGGIRINGAPIDPQTQRIVPTPGVTETVEVWDGIIIEKIGLDALAFTDTCRRKTRLLISNFYQNLALS